MTLYGAGQEPQIKWVAFITILMFGLAVFFALFLSAMEEPLENIVGMSAIFVVAGLICGAYTLRASRSMSAAKGLLSGGVAGTARVLGLQQTGRYMNEQPHVQMELAVETKEHGSYTTTHAEYVPMVMLGTLTNGRPIGVRVDAKDRTKLVIDWDATMAGGLSGGDPSVGVAGAGVAGAELAAAAPWATSNERDAMRARVLAVGMDATATVLASTPTGTTDAEGKPVFDITLFVQAPGRQPIQGTSRVGVPLERVGRIVQGATLPMKVDRTDPSIMAVDWSRA